MVGKVGDEEMGEMGEWGNEKMGNDSGEKWRVINATIVAPQSQQWRVIGAP